jgi:hypothetical protein
MPKELLHNSRKECIRNDGAHVLTLLGAQYSMAAQVRRRILAYLTDLNEKNDESENANIAEKEAKAPKSKAPLNFILQEW